MNTRSHQEHSFIYRFIVYGTELNGRDRYRLYAKIFLVCSLVIWLLIGSFVFLKPETYTSRWTLIFPGKGNGHAVNLESIGQASATSPSPYTNSKLDPGVNYKAITNSFPVLNAAAEQVKIPVSAFGKPKIKLVDQTSLMEFAISGRSAEEAQQKAIALYEALQQQLERLRDDEQASINQAGMSIIDDFSEKLEETQQQTLAYQAQSGLVSLEQFKQMVVDYEQRRHSLAQLEGEIAATQAKIQQLSQHIPLTQQQLGFALRLRNDNLFQELMARYSKLNTEYQSNKRALGTQHPHFQQLAAARSGLADSLLELAQKLLGTKLPLHDLLSLASKQFDKDLLVNLVELHSKNSGDQAQFSQLKLALDKLKQRIDSSTSDAVRIEDLLRKQQVATAVFSTALAKLDIGKADRYSAYPLVQLLASPSLPSEADSLGIILAVAAGSLATMAIFIGLVLLWLRKRLLQKILKNA